MAFQDIVNLLHSEAEEKSAELLVTAAEKKTAVLEAATQQVEKISTQCDRALESQKQGIVKKANSAVLQKERTLTSQMQKTVVDSLFDELQQKLKNASDEDLEKLFSTLLSSVSEEKGEVVALGKTSEKIVKKAVKLAEKKFSISQNLDSAQLGFLFNGEGFSMDFSFDALIRTGIRPTYEGEVFKKLFG